MKRLLIIITGALVFIDKEGQTIEGFQFSKNKLNCAVSIPMIVYIGKGDYPILHNFELIGNRARGNSKISVSIKNKSGKATSLRNNRGIDVEEANVL